MAERSHSPEETTDGGAPPRTALAHIMVVDDQPIVREFLAGILEQQGYRVTMCASGPQALEKARTDAPGVLVTDLRMGEMDGQKSCGACARAPAVVPIVVTGYGTVQHAVDLMREGRSTCSRSRARRRRSSRRWRARSSTTRRCRPTPTAASACARTRSSR
jgi:CheY-like chemotaxis protein